jgi:hypothetical protein
MKIRNPHFIASVVVGAFFAMVLGISFVFNSHYPVLVISGESSVGTWISGALLVTASVLSMVIGMKKGWLPWILFFLFFIVLALDERFMFHEQLKEQMIFNMKPVSASWHWIYELPVLFGSFMGVLIAMLLWRNLCRRGKILLLCAVFLGSISVAFDIFTAGAFIEDILKLLAELFITIALIGEIDTARIRQ